MAVGDPCFEWDERWPEFIDMIRSGDPVVVEQVAHILNRRDEQIEDWLTSNVCNASSGGGDMVVAALDIDQTTISSNNTLTQCSIIESHDCDGFVTVTFDTLALTGDSSGRSAFKVSAFASFGALSEGSPVTPAGSADYGLAIAVDGSVQRYIDNRQYDHSIGYPGLAGLTFGEDSYDGLPVSFTHTPWLAHYSTPPAIGIYAWSGNTANIGVVAEGWVTIERLPSCAPPP